MASQTTQAHLLISRIEATANQVSHDQMSVRFQNNNVGQATDSNTVWMPQMDPEQPIDSTIADQMIAYVALRSSWVKNKIASRYEQFSIEFINEYRRHKQRTEFEEHAQDQITNLALRIYQTIFDHLCLTEIQKQLPGTQSAIASMNNNMISNINCKEIKNDSMPVVPAAIATLQALSISQTSPALTKKTSDIINQTLEILPDLSSSIESWRKLLATLTKITSYDTTQTIITDIIEMMPKPKPKKNKNTNTKNQEKKPPAASDRQAGNNKNHTTTEHEKMENGNETIENITTNLEKSLIRSENITPTYGTISEHILTEFMRQSQQQDGPEYDDSAWIMESLPYVTFDARNPRKFKKDTRRSTETCTYRLPGQARKHARYTKLTRLLSLSTKPRIKHRTLDGILDTKAIVEMATGQPNIFKQRVTHQTRSAAIYILVDISSSTLTGDILAMLLSACRDIAHVSDIFHSIKIAISAYTTITEDMRDGGLTLSSATIIIKDFNDRASQADHSITTLCQDMINGMTPTGSALLRAIPELEKQPEKTKIAIILTDGQASDQDNLDVACRIARQSGIIIASIEIGPESQTNNNSGYRYPCKSPDDIPQMLEQAIIQQIK